MTRFLLFLINRSFTKNDKTTLHQKQEMLAHIQQQTGLPPMPPASVPSRVAAALVLTLGLVGLLIYLVTILTVIIWFIIAALTDPLYYLTTEKGIIAAFYGPCVIGLASYIINHIAIRTFQNDYLSWRWPRRTISLFAQLQQNSFLIEGRIDSVKHDHQIAHIGYSFCLPDSDQPIRGNYLTTSNPSLVPGEAIMVRYLDAAIHLPLFERQPS
jgi:hypothetical protein